MRKIIFIAVGLVIAIIGYWLLSPLFITREVNESLDDIAHLMTPQNNIANSELNRESPATSMMSEENLAVEEPKIITLKQGEFEGLAGHSAQGSAKLINIGKKNFIRFENDFLITNGPDLFVYLGKDDKYDKDTQLAALKGNKGGQNYEIPDAIDISAYNEVWVWCRAFSVPFGKAELQ